jgi:hypothetical protein
MKDILMLEILIFTTGLFLWVLDDPYIPEAKLLGSAWGTKIMKWSFISLILTLLIILI